MYIGIDLAVEIVVFACSVLSLKLIYPQFHTGRILCGLFRTHAVEMFMLGLTIWLCNLMYQSTYSGVDLTLDFNWLSDGDWVWLGGFDWCLRGSESCLD